jgi:hypothetical protein
VVNNLNALADAMAIESDIRPGLPYEEEAP